MNSNMEKPYVVGIDIGGTNTVFGIVGARGTIIASSSIKTAGYPTAEEYADEVCKNLLPLIIANGGVDKIRGIGVGAPNGNYYTGTIEFAPNLPWRGILPLAAMFEERLGIPTALTYDANAAAIGDIVNTHMSVYGTLDNLHEKVAIHINDTHPTLAIPELMRILLDDCGYTWEKAWDVVINTFAYTNHTVMAEALEKWDVNLVKHIIPRIFSIIVEINNRYCRELMEKNGNDSSKTTSMSIIKDNQIHMATLCVVASHSVNGVSKLHSDIIKHSVFKNEYEYYPYKFKNVTNGIAYRRWLYQSNPGLTNLLREKIGDKFL